MKKLLIICFSFLFLAFECSELNENDPMVNQDILFAKIYKNDAMGQHIEGWFIDNTGYVKGFSNLRNTSLDWKYTSDGGFISEEDLIYNYLQSDTTFANLRIPELIQYYNRSLNAVKGTLTESDFAEVNKGQISYYTLQYFPENNKYKFVLMESQGDYIVQNTSNDAVRIADWLKSIDRDLAVVNFD